MKTQFESHIYEIDENKKVLNERTDLIFWIILLLMILFIVIEWIWMAIIAISVILVSAIVTMITRWGVIEPLNGNFTKDLVINENEIIVGDVCYPVSELRIRRITTDDYHGLSTTGYSFYARYPMKSNGTSNHLRFVYKGQDFKYQFRIRGKSHLEQLEELKNNIRIKW